MTFGHTSLASRLEKAKPMLWPRMTVSLPRTDTGGKAARPRRSIIQVLVIGPDPKTVTIAKHVASHERSTISFRKEVGKQPCVR